MAIGSAIASVGASVYGAKKQSDAAKDSARAQEQAGEAAIREQQAAREDFNTRVQPFTEIGLDAGNKLQSLLSDPSQQLSEINPVVDFLRNEGFTQIQESAAAQGEPG